MPESPSELPARRAARRKWTVNSVYPGRSSNGRMSTSDSPAHPPVRVSFLDTEQLRFGLHAIVNAHGPPELQALAPIQRHH